MTSFALCATGPSINEEWRIAVQTGGKAPQTPRIFSPRRSETLALGQVARLLDCFIAAVFPFTAGNDLQNAIR
jgi:hypothetical protein